MYRSESNQEKWPTAPVRSRAPRPSPSPSPPPQEREGTREIRSQQDRRSELRQKPSSTQSRRPQPDWDFETDPAIPAKAQPKSSLQPDASPPVPSAVAQTCVENPLDLYNSATQDPDAYVDESSVQMKQCGGCGRSFNINAFAKHEKICAKVFQKKRKKFDDRAQRLADLDNDGRPLAGKQLSQYSRSTLIEPCTTFFNRATSNFMKLTTNQTILIHSDVPTNNSLPVSTACLAQSVERQALNLMVVGSSPTVGAFYFLRQKS
jgi:hypothetical protein